MKRKIAILITSHNRKNKTLRCLQSVYDQENIDILDLDIYLTDDNSQDGTKDEIQKRYPKVKVLIGNGNLYWGGGTNLAFKTAVKENKYDYYMWLNDDTYLFDNAISDLLKPKKKFHLNEFISVGSTKNTRNELSYGGKKNFGNFITTFKGKKIKPNKNYQYINRFNGNIVLISKKAQKKIGFINEKLTHILGDIEYGLRASNLNIPILLCPDFQGFCENDKKENLLKDYFKGKKLIQSYYVFTKKYGGLFWVLHFFSAIINSLKK